MITIITSTTKLRFVTLNTLITFFTVITITATCAAKTIMTNLIQIYCFKKNKGNPEDESLSEIIKVHFLVSFSGAISYLSIRFCGLLYLLSLLLLLSFCIVNILYCCSSIRIIYLVRLFHRFEYLVFLLSENFTITIVILVLFSILNVLL